MELNSDDDITIAIIESGLVTWHDLVRSVQHFHFGRNENRSDLSLVWSERKGTCSSKHAFLKLVAELNGFSNVKLFLGIYKMNEANTLEVGSIINENKLDYIPEAHCYLKIDGVVLDVTSKESNFERIAKDIVYEKEIQPKDVAVDKVEIHQAFLKEWIVENEIPYSFQELWDIREACIKSLEN